MENTEIDMVISIPDTPDRPVRRASLSTREVNNKRQRSPEASVRFQRGEHRHCPNGRARTVSEASSDTQTEHGHHRSRASGSSNALFRRAAVEKDKGKSICIDDPSLARVEKVPVLNLNRRDGLTTASTQMPSEDVRDDGSSPNKGKGIVVDCGSVSNRETINLSSERKPIRGTRRLVRNGCISPHGIAARARARQAADDTNSKDTVSLEQELALEAASSIDIREIVSDDHVRGRARGKRPEISPSRVASRDGSGGWVSTHSRSLNIDHEINRRAESDTRGTSSFVSGLNVLEAGGVDREARPQRRRKNGVTPSRFEPQVSATGEPSSSRPQNYQRQGRQVLEIEDSSPDVRVFRAPRRVENDESDVMARQIEADALMARELQEQLYAESTMRTEQMDETIARLMEQEENSLRTSSGRASTRNTRSSNTIAADPGGSSRVEGRLQQHSSRRRMNPPQPRRAAVRAPARARPRHLSRPHASLLDGAMDFNFPSGMGLDSRMDFLESLENVIGHSFNNSNLLHMDRDFTEDDYELLLALDENNHQHGGASSSRINNLPESTVQTDNFQETCVICLETPTIGDTIRHLPCFHKFHKDCIDPWLGRSKACPVCKSSVS